MLYRRLASRSFSISALKQYSEYIWADPYTEQLIPKYYEQMDQLKRVTDALMFSPDLPAYSKYLSTPVWEMLSRAGKTWRGTLCLLTAKAFEKNPEDVLPLAISCELIHNGSLIIDDFEDKSDMRRGKPAIHKMFGADLAINSGNFLYFIGQMCIDDAKISEPIKQEIRKVYTKEMLALHFGQCSDIYWNKLHDWAPSADQYFQMISFKTAVMVRLALQIAAISAECPPHVIKKLLEFADKFGLAFQIKDDLLNLESEEYAEGRSYVGEDITEGKRTLLVLRALEEKPEKADRLMEILNMKTRDQEIVKEGLGIIKSTDALEYAKITCENFLAESLQILDEIFPAGKEKDLIVALANFLVYRTG